jgi:hypothetical protein
MPDISSLGVPEVGAVFLDVVTGLPQSAGAERTWRQKSYQYFT